MSDYNSPEEVAKRANQEDPIVMYLIVRESLNMGVGKTAAQCAHASQMMTLKYFEEKPLAGSFKSITEQEFGFTVVKHIKGPSFERVHMFDWWLHSSFRKVVLKADDKEWEKIKSAFPDSTLVIDSGLTEIAPNSETVIGLWPMLKSEAQKTIIKKLQALK